MIPLLPPKVVQQQAFSILSTVQSLKNTKQQSVGHDLAVTDGNLLSQVLNELWLKETYSRLKRRKRSLKLRSNQLKWFMFDPKILICSEK